MSVYFPLFGSFLFTHLFVFPVWFLSFLFGFSSCRIAVHCFFLDTQYLQGFQSLRNDLRSFLNPIPLPKRKPPTIDPMFFVQYGCDCLGCPYDGFDHGLDLNLFFFYQVVKCKMYPDFRS